MRRVERFLPVVLWSLLAWFCTRQISPLGWSAFWAVTGVVLGSIWLERNKSLPVKTSFLWIASLAISLLAERLGHFALQFSWPSVLLGADRVIGLTLCLRAFTYWCCGFVAVRWSCLRRPLFSLVESAIFCLLVLWIFAGHQQGFINRPFFFVDPIWGRGIDPTPMFLLVGLGAVLVVSLFLGQGQVGVRSDSDVEVPVGFTAVARPRWRLWNVVLLACLLGGLFVMLPAQKIREYSEKYGPADGDTPSDEKRYGSGKGKKNRGPSQSGQSGTPTPNPSGEPVSATPGPNGSPVRPTPDASGAPASPTPGLNGQSGGSPSPNPSGEPASASPTPGPNGQSGGSPSPNPSGEPASASPTPGPNGQSGGSPSPNPSGSTASGSPTPGEDGQSGTSPTPSPSGASDSPTPDQSSASPPPPDQPASQPPRQQQQFSNGSSSSKNQPVAVVVFKDDYQPECQTYYFRQNAFSQFNGIKLVASADSRFDRDIPLQHATHSRNQSQKGELAGMQLLPISPQNFKQVSSRVAVLSQHFRPFGLSNPVAFWACDNPDPARFQKAFEVDSMVLTLPYQNMISLKQGQSSWKPDDWKHYLDGPKDPRYRKLVEQILKEKNLSLKSSGFSKAVAIKLWLDDNCTYSLKSDSADQADPVGNFLFGDRTGYCVFTSHAAAYLYRAAGIPSRIAEGYAVPSSNRGSGSALLIREREAHSWPEVYFEGLAWIALDITPKKSLVQPEDQVDPGLQQMLGDMAREQSSDSPADSPEQPHLNLQELFRQLLLRLAAGLPWAVGLTALFMMGIKVSRRLRPYSPWGSPDPSLTFYQSILDRLADRGYSRKAGSSREGFAEQLQTLVPSLKGLTVLHLSTRLGAAQAQPEEARHLWKATQQEVNRVPKTWRYYVRLVNPVSWWSVK